MGIPIWPSAGVVAWGSENSPYGTYFTTGTVTSAAVTLAAGWWWVLTGAHNTVQAKPDATNAVTILAVSSRGNVFSDGTFTIVNDSTGGTAANYAQILGGGP